MLSIPTDDDVGLMLSIPTDDDVGLITYVTDSYLSTPVDEHLVRTLNDLKVLT